MSNNPIHTLENVVITLLAQTECDLQKIREFFNQRFAPNQELLSEDFKKAYMHIFFFVPSNEVGNQRLIYRTLQGRFMLHRTQLLGILRLKLNIANETEKKDLNQVITMLEMLPEMI